MTGDATAVLQPYCENDMRLLKRLSKKILGKIRLPLSESDYTEFYSIANLTLWKAYQSFDPAMGVNFEGFLCTCLKKKFMDEMSRRNRQKRTADRTAVSLDAPINENEDGNFQDLIPSDFDTFEEVLKLQDKGKYQDKVERYISKLSTMQINILNLLIEGYESSEIKNILHLSEREYSSNIATMRSYENVKILF